MFRVYNRTKFDFLTRMERKAENPIEHFYTTYDFGTTWQHHRNRFFSTDTKEDGCVLWWPDGYRFNGEVRCGYPDAYRWYLYMLCFPFGRYYQEYPAKLEDYDDVATVHYMSSQSEDEDDDDDKDKDLDSDGDN